MTPEQWEAFHAAVATLAGVFRSYSEKTGVDPILVGGATVVLLTKGQFFSGDFDFLAADDEVMAGCLGAAGFSREDRDGHLWMGWYHADHPLFGFQQVSGTLFDGRTEHARIVRLELMDGSVISLPPVEDMIADRLAQHATASPTDMSRLEQAKAMLLVLGTVDRAYLLRRVLDEGGDITPLLSYIPDNTSGESEGGA